MEKIPCIPRPPGLQTSWRMCGEAGQAGLGPWDPIPKVSSQAVWLLSLSLQMFSCLFAVPRRVRGNQIIDFQAFPKKKRHLCEHTLTHTHSRTASILQTRSFPTTHVLI